MGVSPAMAPDAPTYVTLDFEKAGLWPSTGEDEGQRHHPQAEQAGRRERCRPAGHRARAVGLHGQKIGRSTTCRTTRSRHRSTRATSTVCVPVSKPPSTVRAPTTRCACTKSIPRCAAASSEPTSPSWATIPRTYAAARPTTCTSNWGSLPSGHHPRRVVLPDYGRAWIYVLAPEGDKAYKRPIRIGRQNPQYYEVLDGLEPGERVIVSGYENYGSNDVLILNK